MTEPSAATTETAERRQETAGPQAEPEPICYVCSALAGEACGHCGALLCHAHAYREAEGESVYCRACADELVGVCHVCDALHAGPCEACGRKVCDAHAVRIVKRWGWGGAPGQGGLTDWFPMRATYCLEHGQGRSDAPRPRARKMKGYDGSSPEW